MNDRCGFDQDPVALEKLIDGELSRDEERDLFRELVEQPDGWRRCALAFLEARALREEMGAITGELSQRVNGTAALINVAERSRASRRGARGAMSRKRWGHLLTLATSLMIAFCLGIVVRGQWMQRLGGDREGQLVVEGDRKQLGGSIKRDGIGGAGADDAWQMATLTMNVLNTDGEKQSEIELPLVEAETLDANLLQSKPAAVSQRVREALVKSGHTLEEERLLVPVLLEDGRRAIVAVDRAQVSVGVTY